MRSAVLFVVVRPGKPSCRYAHNAPERALVQNSVVTLPGLLRFEGFQNPLIKYPDTPNDLQVPRTLGFQVRSLEQLLTKTEAYAVFCSCGTCALCSVQAPRIVCLHSPSSRTRCLPRIPLWHLMFWPEFSIHLHHSLCLAALSPRA